MSALQVGQQAVPQAAWKQKIAKLAEYDIQHHASLLKYTTLIIWACSLAAEVGTFAANKKLPPKEKSFIIKQELTAGGISLAIMYLLADRFEKFGEWLVNKGKLVPSALPQQWRNSTAIQKILKADPTFLKTVLKGDKAWIEKLGGFKKGVSVMAGTIGTIIAFNITTPLISNKIASYFQNRSWAQKMNLATANTPAIPNNLPTLTNPVSGVSTAMAAPVQTQPPLPLQPMQAMPYYRYTPFRQATFYR